MVWRRAVRIVVRTGFIIRLICAIGPCSCAAVEPTCENSRAFRSTPSMARKNTNDVADLVVALKIFGGLHKRVAIKVGVDPTFVCRVAHSERRSPEVSNAIREELRAGSRVFSMTF